ncbi:MAG: papain-like cysteine protease family protein [Actinomycetota bacterium]
MRRLRVVLALAVPVLFMAVALVLLLAPAAFADNCDLRINPEDCQNTAWTVGAVAATAAAITGILTALSGLGGAGAPASVEEQAEGASPAGPAGAPVIHQQRWNDSCATVTSQMIIERATGEKIPENFLRAQSHQTPNGYRRVGNFGTNPEGVVELLEAHGLTAENQTLDLGEMREALRDGKQVSISIKVPGGNHRVLVTKVDPSPTGGTTITFDDPATGTTRQMNDVGWQNRGNPTRTIVVLPK